MLTIDIETAHRFILGKQGLWPGRRWRGLKGTEQAMRAVECTQQAWSHEHVHGSGHTTHSR